MSITASITSHPDAIGVYYGSSQVLVGDHIVLYADNADETTGYPCVLPNGDTIDDDRDLNDLLADLNSLGYETEADSEGLYLVEA